MPQADLAMNIDTGLKCPSCGQKFLLGTFKVATALYGFFVLNGKTVFLGTTCPRCLKSFANTIDDKSLKELLDGIYCHSINERLKKIASIGKRLVTIPSTAKPVDISSLLILDSTPSNIRPINIVTPSFKRDFSALLNYYSIPNFFIGDTPNLENFNIIKWENFEAHACMGIKDLENDIFFLVEHDLGVKKSKLDDLLCSYIPGYCEPTGRLFTIFWYQEDEIEKLIDFENSHKIKIFPRYIHNESILELFEEYFWDVYLKELYWKETAPFEILKKVPTLVNSKFLEMLMIEQSTRIVYLKPFFRREHPFFNTDVPQFIPGTEFYGSSTESELNRVPEYAEIVDGMNYAQEFLAENSMVFAKECFDLVKRNDFSYFMLHQLKEKYIQRLIDHIRKQKRLEVKYAIYFESPTWTITFDGVTNRGLKSNGFKYIHFLVKNKRQQFHTDRLSELFPDDKDEETQIAFANDSDFSGINSEQLMIDKRAKHAYKNGYKRLKEAFNDSKNNPDPLIRMEAENELKKFLKYYKHAFDHRGNIRNFRNDSIKNKDKITKSIERALKSIEKHNPEAYQHLHSALKPINDFNQCYNPLKDIEWYSD